MNKKIEKERPELNPILVKSPWFHLGIDFIGPISTPSSAGNWCILTVLDYFMKFGWVHALPTKEAVGVVAALWQGEITLCTYRRIVYLGSLLMGISIAHAVVRRYSIPNVFVNSSFRVFRNSLPWSVVMTFGSPTMKNSCKD